MPSVRARLARSITSTVVAVPMVASSRATTSPTTWMTSQDSSAMSAMRRPEPVSQSPSRSGVRPTLERMPTIDIAGKIRTAADAGR